MAGGLKHIDRAGLTKEDRIEALADRVFEA
jgi:hypothetical protein